MPAGTITLTNNSTAVTGSGTAFPSELKANDFLVAVVGGTTYTLGVKSVESATALTLATAYGGPTTGGLAWTPIPNGTLVGITAQIAADTARAIRGLNYDKQNWQQVYSASGNITVTLPDGSTYTGPSWKYLSDNMATKVGGVVPVAQGGTGAPNIEQARNTLGLKGVGALSKSTQLEFAFSTIDPALAALRGYTLGAFRNTASMDMTGPYGISQNSACIFSQVTDCWFLMNVPHIGNGGIRVMSGYGSAGVVRSSLIWDNVNTVVDGNGFIKRASPVVKIFAAGNAETNDESEGVAVVRQGVGEYLITGCLGLNADAAWGGFDGGFEIPVDRNKQPRIWLDYEMNPDGSILVKTFHRTHNGAPVFAQNLIEGVTNGDSIDIPVDSFVSVRVEMPADSIWNQKQEAAQSELREAHTARQQLVESSSRETK